MTTIGQICQSQLDYEVTLKKGERKIAAESKKKFCGHPVGILDTLYCYSATGVLLDGSALF